MKEITTTSDLDTEKGWNHEEKTVKFLAREVSKVIISEHDIDGFVAGLNENKEKLDISPWKGRPTNEEWIYSKLSDAVEEVVRTDDFFKKLEKAILEECILLFRDKFIEDSFEKWFRDIIYEFFTNDENNSDIMKTIIRLFLDAMKKKKMNGGKNKKQKQR